MRRSAISDWTVKVLIVVAIAAVILVASPPAPAQSVEFDDFPSVTEPNETAELVVSTHIPTGLKPGELWPGPQMGIVVIGPSLLDPPDPGGVIFEPPLGAIVFGSCCAEPGAFGLLMMSVSLADEIPPFPGQPWTPAYTELGIPGSWFILVVADGSGHWVGATDGDPPPGGWEPFTIYVQFAWLDAIGEVAFTQATEVVLP